MATLSRIYSKCGVLSFVMFVGLIISLLFTLHTFLYMKNVDSNTLLSSSAIGQEISAKLHPMSKILDKVKDTVVVRPRPLPTAPLAAATVLAPQPATPSQLLIPPAATAVQCAAVAPSGRLYPKGPVRRGEWHRIVNFGPEAGYKDDFYCDCPGGTKYATVTATVLPTPTETTSAARIAQIAIVNSRSRNRPQRMRGGWVREQQEHVVQKGEVVLAVRTDEPGTDACSMQLAGQKVFHCGTGSFDADYIFSSRVHDGICDCCDGSDELGSPWPGVSCPNTCNALQAAYVQQAEELRKEKERATEKERRERGRPGQSEHAYRGRLSPGRMHGQIGRGRGG